MHLSLKNVNLIDTLNKHVVENVTVNLENGLITSVSRSDSAVACEHTIDLSGKFLLPGLIDAHVHLNTNISSGPTLDKPVPNKRINRDYSGIISRLHSYLYCGVTAVCDLGNDPNLIYKLRGLERQGKIISPRIFCVGGVVTCPGGHGHQFGTLIREMPLDEEKLESHLSNLPDVVKVTYDEHNWGVRPLIPILSKTTLKKIIDYCHSKRLRVTVHVSNEYRAREAIECGADVLAHPVIQSPITDDFAWLVATKGIPVISTLAIGERYYRLADDPSFVNSSLYKDCLSPKERRVLYGEESERQRKNVWASWMKVMTPIAQRNIKLMIEAGVPVATGTDLALGPDYLHELELLQSAGIDPLDVIVCGTLNAARAISLERELGSISKGKRADMIVVDDDPTKDVRNLKNLSLVIKNGTVINRKELDLPVNRIKSQRGS